MLTTNVMYQKISKELAKFPNDSLKTRVRIIEIASNREDIFDPSPEFATAFQVLLRSEKITCLASGKSFEELPPPCLAIIDPFAGYAVDAIRAAEGDRIPIYLWRTSPAGSILRHNGPPELGGRESLSAVTTSIAESDARNLSIEPSQIPGAPPMFEYEWTPQKACCLTSDGILVRALPHTTTPIKFTQSVASPPNILQNTWKEAQRVLAITDGVLNVSSSFYEPDAIRAAQHWYSSMGKAWYTVGPLFFPRGQQAGAEFEKIQEIEFLDKMKALFGVHSVIYISFGTVPWQTLPDKIWMVIDELIRDRTPFILARPSKLSHLPDEQKAKIKDSGIGLELRWADQEAILSHPATGWFISHGGWNSIQESFVHKVPCIFWPFEADQPYNAAMITLNYRAGFELLSVRHEGSRQPFRCKESPEEQSFTAEAVRQEVKDLLVKIKADEGRVVRANAEKLSLEMSRSWEEGQGSFNNLQELLRRFVDESTVSWPTL
ncbi:hypothetical protein V5O48_002278 [Marasmius crinis-equi]|uniref:UDP-Glycosyltransferase/glycogen phosphorylase n=1 Tax=Marasmius crinis-equi TaxID=585013 RepID=A0ABR3FW74_9AGAR